MVRGGYGWLRVGRGGYAWVQLRCTSRKFGLTDLAESGTIVQSSMSLTVSLPRFLREKSRVRVRVRVMVRREHRAHGVFVTTHLGPHKYRANYSATHCRYASASCRALSTTPRASVWSGCGVPSSRARAKPGFSARRLTARGPRRRRSAPVSGYSAETWSIVSERSVR